MCLHTLPELPLLPQFRILFFSKSEMAHIEPLLKKSPVNNKNLSAWVSRGYGEGAQFGWTSKNWCLLQRCWWWRRRLYTGGGPQFASTNKNSSLPGTYKSVRMFLFGPSTNLASGRYTPPCMQGKYKTRDHRCLQQLIRETESLDCDQLPFKEKHKFSSSSIGAW